MTTKYSIPLETVAKFAADVTCDAGLSYNDGLLLLNMFRALYLEQENRDVAGNLLITQEQVEKQCRLFISSLNLDFAQTFVVALHIVNLIHNPEVKKLTESEVKSCHLN